MRKCWPNWLKRINYKQIYNILGYLPLQNALQPVSARIDERLTMYKDELYNMPKKFESRWASPENVYGQKGGGGKTSHGRKGSPNFHIRPGRTITLAEVSGRSGVVRRIWMTLHDLSPFALKRLRISFYWDGRKDPAADVPLGDFFCMGLGRMTAFDSALFSSPEGRSFQCFIPMPFRKGMRITLTNDGSTTAIMCYYDVDYTLGDDIEENAGYFHAWYNQELPTTILKDYTILPEVSGRGRFLGASFGVFMDEQKYAKSWGGEGEVKFYLDGDTSYPTLCGTGTEDYIGTGWGQGVFANRYSGCTVADKENTHLCFYRFHIEDLVCFQENIRVTIQQIGSWNPELMQFFKNTDSTIFRAGIQARFPSEKVVFSDNTLPNFDLFERSDNWSSCCYFYLDKPTHDLPELPDLIARAAAIPDFNPKELNNMKEPIPMIETIKEYVPDMDKLEYAQLKELYDALSAVLPPLALQEQMQKKPEDAK